MTDTPLLENWRVVCTGAAYMAPEARSLKLGGNVYGHPGFIDGNPITTSSIIEVSGRRVRTRSRVYLLGTPSPDYVAWCKKNGIDPPTFNEPIRTTK